MGIVSRIILTDDEVGPDWHKAIAEVEVKVGSITADRPNYIEPDIMYEKCTVQQAVTIKNGTASSAFIIGSRVHKQLVNLLNDLLPSPVLSSVSIETERRNEDIRRLSIYHNLAEEINKLKRVTGDTPTTKHLELYAGQLYKGAK